MAIYTGGMRMQGEAQAAARRIAKQQRKAQDAENKRKGRAGLFGKIGGALMGAAAVGLTGLTGGLAAPLVMGVASSLGKKWADEASKGASPFGKALKSPGQVDKITAGGKYGYGRQEASDATKALEESRKTDFSAETMLGDIASSYVTAGISGGLTDSAKTLFSGDKGSIAKALGGKQGAVGGWEGVKQSLGLSEFGADPTMDYKSLDISPEKYDALVASRQAGADVAGADDFWGLGEDVIDYSGQTDEIINPELDELGYSIAYQQGGQVPQMDQNTLIGLAILSEMANQKTAYNDTPLEEEEQQQTISDMFASQGKTLGGSNTQSLSQILGR